jgi:choline dehydrogenase-like flavoprotein
LNRIAIIGSGLAAVSAAKSLIQRGIKPIILDVGKSLDKKTQTVVNNLARTDPGQWKMADRDLVTTNHTVKNKFPMKLAFGSDYFYGKSNGLATKTDGIMLPYSHAKGGFSVGWGATVLPPDNCDLLDWPLNNRHLNKYYKRVLEDLPYSATEDRLVKHFPLMSENISPISLTPGNTAILQGLNKAFDKNQDNVTFGQARVLTQSSENGTYPGCNYCGCCMSGCVYDCIYKSSQDIDRMIVEKTIEYIPNTIVHSISEKENIVEVLVTNKDKQSETLQFNRVFLAAGAVGSTRILMSSRQLYDTEIRLKSTLGFVAPMFSKKRLISNWPKANTQPGVFLEYKVENLSNHWVHTQLSTPNELVYDKLGIKPYASGVLQTIKRKVSEHLMVAHCNIHSEHSNGYFLKLTKTNNPEIEILSSSREEIDIPHTVIKHALKKLSFIGRKIGCYTMTPFVQNAIRTGGFHVGGTLPMTDNPQKVTDTNLLGNPLGWSRIHVIDSSIFPSIPGTTIGLLAMANASRIASEVELI